MLETELIKFLDLYLEFDKNNSNSFILKEHLYLAFKEYLNLNTKNKDFKIGKNKFTIEVVKYFSSKYPENNNFIRPERILKNRDTIFKSQYGYTTNSFKYCKWKKQDLPSCLNGEEFIFKFNIKENKKVYFSFKYNTRKEEELISSTKYFHNIIPFESLKEEDSWYLFKEYIKTIDFDVNSYSTNQNVIYLGLANYMQSSKISDDISKIIAEIEKLKDKVSRLSFQDKLLAKGTYIQSEVIKNTVYMVPNNILYFDSFIKEIKETNKYIDFEEFLDLYLKEGTEYFLQSYIIIAIYKKITASNEKEEELSHKLSNFILKKFCGKDKEKLKNKKGRSEGRYSGYRNVFISIN